MQEIKKRRIVLASVLKPVDDTRMFEKLGQALALHADVHILGYPTAVLPEWPGVSFYPHRPFHRLSLSRFLTPWRIFFKIWRLNPDDVVVTTHELLFQGLILKFFRGSRLFYDVQENYFLNILHTNAFPKPFRWIIGTYVRIKETVLAPFVNHFILAERIYANQLKFVNSNAVVIENKAAGGSTTTRQYGDPVRFIFTGTLAATTGVLEAIRLTEMLRKVDQRITLTIAGYAATEEELSTIRAAVAGASHVRLVGGDHLVPHQEILNLIRTADVGIINYLPNVATEGRRPTKLYEYLAFRLPILARAGADWSKLLNKYKAGILYDPANLNSTEILQNLSKIDFYPTFPMEATWGNEIPRLLEIFGYPNRE